MSGVATSLTTIKQTLSAEEQHWLALLVEAHGEQAVLQMWPSLQVQLDFVRSL